MLICAREKKHLITKKPSESRNHICSNCGVSVSYVWNVINIVNRGCYKEGLCHQNLSPINNYRESRLLVFSIHRVGATLAVAQTLGQVQDLPLQEFSQWFNTRITHLQFIP